ncbi:hypothetical protein [Variovorax guangxiensis]|uniref:DNA-binding protein n=1 Tax=Variovorax guangxiensis TaxID=1775474 RepID=A0A840GA14_9BURK|nr:hypothetical protein [Variovorax guangxiensis]MBB4226021.1 hypothetical protein [Variovorax guangxiensis]
MSFSDDEALTQAIVQATDRLHRCALATGLTVSGDLRVNERDAALLIGYSHGHMKALRQQGNGPRVYALGVAGGRYSYRLDDLASWVEMAAERRAAASNGR